MTNTQIAADIARGAEIRKEIAKLEKELKEIETRLKGAAEKGEHVPLQDKEREGRQCLLRAPRLVLPVRFTADSIVASFLRDSPMHKEIVGIVGDEKLPLLFKAFDGFERAGKDGQAFRKIARENLEPDVYAKLIRAATARDKSGIAKSTVQIAWDDAKEPEAVAAT